MLSAIVATTVSAVTIAWFAAIRLMVDGMLSNLTSVSENIMFNISAILLPTITAMVAFEGFKIITGRSTEPAATYVLKWGKIILLSTTAAYAGTDSESLSGMIAEGIKIVSIVITGQEDVFKIIDSELIPAVALSIMAASLTSNTGGEDSMGRVVTMVASNLGAVMPIVAALFTSLTLAITLKIGTVLAPIFIFAGIFERTAEWPITWAKFMFGVILTSALMALMCKICLAVAAATSLAAVTAYFTGTSALFLSMLYTMEGLFLSVLLISVPGVAMKLLGMASEGVASNQLGGGKNDGSLTKFGNRNVVSKGK